MFEELKIKTAEQTIKRFIQEDYVRLWSKYDTENAPIGPDDGVYFDPKGFPEIEPGLHMIKKSVPTKAQSLNEFLQSTGLDCGSIKEARIFKTSNFNTNVIDNYALVLFDLTVKLHLSNGKTMTMETVAAQTLLLTNKGWRIVNEGISYL